MAESKNEHVPTSTELAEIRWYATRIEARAILLYATRQHRDEARTILQTAMHGLESIKVPTDPCPPGWHRCKEGGCSPYPCMAPDEELPDPKDDQPLVQ